MDFFKSKSSLSKKPAPRIELELLYVHDESLRKKGLASYYFDKLREFAISQNLKCIFVRVNANAKNFKKDSKHNALDQKELEFFYEKRNTVEMPVILCQL